MRLSTFSALRRDREQLALIRHEGLYFEEKKNILVYDWSSRPVHVCISYTAHKSTAIHMYPVFLPEK
jgi:hypothetical protein